MSLPINYRASLINYLGEILKKDIETNYYLNLFYNHLYENHYEISDNGDMSVKRFLIEECIEIDDLKASFSGNKNISNYFDLSNIKNGYIQLNKNSNIGKFQEKLNLESLPYSEQLLRPEWKKKRLEIIKLYNFKCNRCDSKEKLQVHHKEYIKGRLAWEYDNSYLECLCGECHKAEHGLIKVGYRDVKPKRTPGVKMTERERVLQKFDRNKINLFYKLVPVIRECEDSLLSALFICFETCVIKEKYYLINLSMDHHNITWGGVDRSLLVKSDPRWTFKSGRLYLLRKEFWDTEQILNLKLDKK